MIIDMVFVGGSDVLSGSVNGKRAFADLVKLLHEEPEEPSAVYLDFCAVTVATASFLRDSVFAFKNYLRASGSKHYSVVCNINASVYDELALLATARNDVIVNCLCGKDGEIGQGSLIGELDPKQQMTFDLVQRLKQADANTLMTSFGESEGTKTTNAWNNRLSNLAQRGVIREFSKGRAKYYRPLLEKVS
ncbi:MULTISPECIES: hypothetical protein [unclassified Sinorhizobium]|uniref:hypothetical protein n=1 Tax=unclassified Sinorhizobium TaxID=2613772 RepID=UPI003525FC6F